MYFYHVMVLKGNVSKTKGNFLQYIFQCYKRKAHEQCLSNITYGMITSVRMQKHLSQKIPDEI